MIPKIVVVLLVLLGCGYADAVEDSRRYRDMVRLNHKRVVDEHNVEGRQSFKMKLYEKFATKTFEELQQLYLTARLTNKLPLLTSPPTTSPTILHNLGMASSHVNWTQQGKVSPVTDQGYCGSCYAHAAVADIQSSYRFKGINVTLSIQQMVDCTYNFGNMGCWGGWMGQIFDYVRVNGITTYQQYPDRNQTFQTGVEGDCSMKKGQYRIRQFAYTSYREYDCQSLTNIIKKRPVTVAVNANLEFMFYSDGIFNLCSPVVQPYVNHAMVLVGYLQSPQQNYWILRNSWGLSWGEQGYMRLDRYKDYGNQCQLCLAPHYSIL